MMKDVFDILGFSNKEFLLTKLLYSFWSQFSSVPWGNWKRRQRQILVKKRDENWLAGGKRQSAASGSPPRQRPFFLWAVLSIHLPLTLIFGQIIIVVIYEIFIAIFKWLCQCPFRQKTVMAWLRTCVMQNRQHFILLLTKASQFKADSTLSDRKDSTRCMSSLPHLKENRFWLFCLLEPRFR